MNSLNMTMIKNTNIALGCVLLSGLMGCVPTSSEALEKSSTASQNNISIESRNCDRITAILPDRGRYDGISLRFMPKMGAWRLKFEHVPYRNEKPSPIGLLSLEEVAEITSLIVERGGCPNPPYSTRAFEPGDVFSTSIDWWLVEDLYMTGLEAVRLIPENYGGPMTTKVMSYKEVSEAFKAKGFTDTFCSAFEQHEHACVEFGCEYSDDDSCEPQWGSLQQPHFRTEVKDLPMEDVCKIEDCGLEKESKFHLQLVKR